MRPPISSRRVDEYMRLLQELKARHEWAGRILHLDYQFPDWLVSDIVHLQIRKECEVLALASLIFHGDIRDANSRELRQTSAADYIFNKLEKLHPECFPRSARIKEFTQFAREHLSKLDFEWDLAGTIDKAAFLKMYASTHQAAHAGGINARQDKELFDLRREQLMQWRTQIYELLHVHVLVPFESGWTYVFQMEAPETGTVRMISAPVTIPPRAEEPPTS